MTQFSKNKLHIVCSMFILCTAILFSCYRPAPPNVQEKYLKVLKHFENDPLKHQAASFIIKNISAQYALKLRYLNPEGKDLTEPLATYKGNLLAKALQDSLKVSMDMRRIHDVSTLDPDQLIKYIDEAFISYAHSKKVYTFPFDTFMEYVLPYRVGYEDINDWRPYMFKRYSRYLSTFDYKKMKLHQLSLAVIADLDGSSSYVMRRLDHISKPSFNQTLDDILKIRVPFSCEDYAVRSLYILRSLGLPSAYEYIPLQGKFNYGHAQTAILTENGKFYPTVKDTIQFRYQIAKMYRRTFSIQPNPKELILAAGEAENDIPRYFDYTNYVDISPERTDVSDVVLNNIESGNKPVAYLCVYNDGVWKPVEWSKVTGAGKQVRFKNMGRKILYQAAFSEAKSMKLVSAPFILDTLGNINPIKSPSNTARISLSIYRYDRHNDIEIDKGYVLYQWNTKINSWVLQQRKKSGYRKITFDNVLPSSLYKVEPVTGSAEPVRPFTYSNNKQIWW